MTNIALSTGWLFAQDHYEITAQEPFFEVVDGVELSITSEDRFPAYSTPVDKKHVSFHITADWSHLDRVEELAAEQSPTAVVIHPDEVSDGLISGYVDRGVPISIENMDVRKDSGYDVDELESLLETHDTSFTLDVQHAYEHDETMEYAWDLVEMAGDRLAELHVSGETDDEIHSLVHQADNEQEIVSFLEEFYASWDDTPIVIEGRYRTVSEVQSEYSSLNRIC